MLEKLDVLTALLAPTPAPQDEQEGDIPLDTVLEILDRHHVIDDMVTIEGTYGDFINPFAFKSSKKGNNPDVLSRVQMMKDQDKNEFLKAKEPEL